MAVEVGSYADPFIDGCFIRQHGLPRYETVDLAHSS
jgi:hypothetical protein